MLMTVVAVKGQTVELRSPKDDECPATMTWRYKYLDSSEIKDEVGDVYVFEFRTMTSYDVENVRP
jgi:hypothetical protein